MTTQACTVGEGICVVLWPCGSLVLFVLWGTNEFKLLTHQWVQRAFQPSINTHSSCVYYSIYDMCWHAIEWTFEGGVHVMKGQWIEITNTSVSPKGVPALNKYTQQVHTIAYTTCVDMRLNEPLRVVFMLWRANELTLLTQQWVQRVFQTTQ